jgi:hypothetical protein
LDAAKVCAEGIVRVLNFDFSFWQVQHPQNFHIYGVPEGHGWIFDFSRARPEI